MARNFIQHRFWGFALWRALRWAREAYTLLGQKEDDGDGGDCNDTWAVQEGQGAVLNAVCVRSCASSSRHVVLVQFFTNEATEAQAVKQFVRDHTVNRA